MKKIYAILVALSALSLFMVGCSKADDATKTDAPAKTGGTDAPAKTGG